jgi:hypothetical protein
MHSIITAAVGSAATAAVGANRRWSRGVRYAVAATTAAVTMGILVVEWVIIYRLPFDDLHKGLFVAATLLEVSVYAIVLMRRGRKKKSK